jgi:hypothetical protein
MRSDALRDAALLQSMILRLPELVDHHVAVD